MMLLSQIKVNFKGNQAFIFRWKKNHFGIIKKCKNCKNKFFAYIHKRSKKKTAIFCSCLCLGKYRSKNRNPYWKGGKTETHKGYILVSKSNHPYKNNHGYVRQHRLEMEKKIGRYLKPHEDVHHINGIKNDNRIKNLILMTHGEHTTLTNNKRWGNNNGK